MKTVGNVIWVVLSGFWMALGWLVWAALFAVTIVGLPFARQCLKLARFTLWPFGRTAVRSADASALGLVGNVLWFIPGVLLAIGYAVSGALMRLTVIGIPLGMQAFKFIPLFDLPSTGAGLAERRCMQSHVASRPAESYDEGPGAPKSVGRFWLVSG